MFTPNFGSNIDASKGFNEKLPTFLFVVYFTITFSISNLIGNWIFSQFIFKPNLRLVRFIIIINTNITRLFQFFH
jgi:hypothetical protein